MKAFRRLELILLGAVSAEAVVGRILTRGLEKKPVFIKGVPQTIVPPTWFVALDYVAVFLIYFALLLGVAVLVQHASQLGRAARERAAPLRRIDQAIGAVTLGALALAASVAGVVEPGPMLVPLHLTLGLIAVHQVARVWARHDELGCAIGISLCAMPVLLYCFASILSNQLWNEDQMLGGQAQATLDKYGRAALVIAAIGSPYCLAPRPFARSMTRLLPFVVALTVAGAGAVMLRLHYVPTVKAANRLMGLDLRTDAPQDQLALYLLAFATITWTVVACLTAPTPARRTIGVGLALLVLAGCGFDWPMSFATAGAGLVLLGEGAAAVRNEERALVGPVTPPVDDEIWQGYVGHVVTSLRKLAGDDGAVSAVSVRGEGDHTSTVIVTERGGVPVRVRIERLGRAVVVVDVVCGREVDSSRTATWSVVARGQGLLAGVHPEPPPAGPLIKADDAPFDERLRARGDRDALLRVLDDALRARLAVTLDGWLAYWDGQSLRHRVFPGQGAPMDQPIPLSMLAVERRTNPASAERLVMLVELCAEIAARGLPVNDAPEPEEDAS